ncbi:MAG: hypothetical protein ACTSPY_00800 [Candidatus Helarchaeota archaeon]
MDENIYRFKSIIEKRNMFKAMRTEYIKGYIREAFNFYNNYYIKEEIIYKAINILSRYLYIIHPEWPREKYGFFAAALYIAIHSPIKNNLGQYQTKKEFIKKLRNISLSSLDWYINRIQDALGMYRIHDNRLRSFWIDEDAFEMDIINGIIKGYMKNLRDANNYPYEMIVEEVVQIIIKKMGLIPKQFRREFCKYIFKKLEVSCDYIES